LNALAILIAAYLLPGVVVNGVFAAIVLAIVLGLINVFIKPLFLILTLPLNILTLGLFTLVINALMILLASKILEGFSVAGFWTALWFGIVLWALNMIFNRLFHTNHQPPRPHINQ
jgi:putative membrane protein